MPESPNLPEQLHQRPGTAVGAPVEAPYRIDNEERLTSNDILLPRMKLVQKMSRVLDDELAEYGAVYVYMGNDDMEPSVIAAAPAKGELGPAVRFYTMGDPRKGWSWTRPDNSLGRGQSYPNLGWVINQDPRKVNRTYGYLLALPDYPMLPVGFLMYGSWGGDGAKFINSQRVLARKRGDDPDLIPFKLQTYKTSNKQGKSEQPFVKAIIGLDKVAAKDRQKGVDLVESLRDLVGQSNVTITDEDTAPADATASAVEVPAVD